MGDTIQNAEAHYAQEQSTDVKPSVPGATAVCVCVYNKVAYFRADN